MQKQTKQIHLHLETIGNIVSLEYGSGLTESKRKGGKYPVFGSNGVVGHHDEYSVNGPGIIVGRKGSIGEVNWSDESFWPIDTTYFVKLKNEETSLRWVYYMLSHKNLKDLNSATGIPGLNRNDVYNTTCFLPDLKEQQKIASILSNVDSLIQKTDQIIEQTRILKKGLMQRLLTKGIGHTKFKKTELGDIPEEWQIFRLIDLCKKKPQYGAAVSAIPKNDSMTRYVRITDIDDNGKLKSNSVVGIHENNAKPFHLAEGDILFARTGSIGRTYIYSKEDGKCAFAGYLIRFIPDQDKLNLNFLFHYTHSNIYWKWIDSIHTRGVLQNINAEQYSQMPIPIPSLHEQQKIASILSNVDLHIQKQQEFKSKIENLKKGLMQQLLTGKIRVKV